MQTLVAPHLELLLYFHLKKGSGGGIGEETY